MGSTFVSIDEFSSMYYNSSIADVLTDLNIPVPRYDNNDFEKVKGTLQKLGLDYNFEIRGCYLSFSYGEWEATCKSLKYNWNDCIHALLAVIRVHVHHQGLYDWFCRSDFDNWDNFTRDLVYSYLKDSVGSDDVSKSFRKITRLDIAYDLINYPDSDPWLRYFGLSKLQGFPIYGIKGQRCTCKVVGGKDDSFTLYMGSDNSDRKFRIYNKLIERKFKDRILASEKDSEKLISYPFIRGFLSDHEYIDSWTRFELELRRQEAAKYLPFKFNDLTFLDCPEFSFYQLLKFVKVNREGHEEIEQNLLKHFSSSTPVKFVSNNQIIQNEYLDSSLWEKNIKKALLRSLFYRAAYGEEKYISNLSVVEALARDPASPERKLLDLWSLSLGYSSFENLPCFDHFDLNGHLVCNYYSSNLPAEFESVADFEKHFEQLNFLDN